MGEVNGGRTREGESWAGLAGNAERQSMMNLKCAGIAALQLMASKTRVLDPKWTCPNKPISAKHEGIAKENALAHCPTSIQRSSRPMPLTGPYNISLPGYARRGKFHFHLSHLVTCSRPYSFIAIPFATVPTVVVGEDAAGRPDRAANTRWRPQADQILLAPYASLRRQGDLVS